MDRAWFLGYSWEDPAARALLTPLSTQWIGGGPRIAIHCKPERLTPSWTAILLCHELEHLEAAWAGREPLPSPWTHYYEGERSAYELQRAAADVRAPERSAPDDLVYVHLILGRYLRRFPPAAI